MQNQSIHIYYFQQSIKNRSIGDVYNSDSKYSMIEGVHGKMAYR